MNAATYEKFRSLIHRRMGIDIGETKQSLIESRLNKRMRSKLIQSYEDYYKLLMKDHSEWPHFENIITTNHTYFFREQNQFYFLLKDFVEKTEANYFANKRCVLWCAASSSGEEPYSILMTLARRLNLEKLHPKLEVLATDLSQEILEKAVRGIYPDKELMKIDPMDKLKFFDEVGENNLQVKKNIQKWVAFNKMNLTHFPYRMKGPFEYIFIRNVMIYFDSQTVIRILKECHRLLAPNGLIFLGSSESLPRELLDLYSPMKESIYRAKK